ncbi:MAG: hypothetical protein QNJ17_15010, partial [Desulfocapsaceae bacterium]|nr:hypothetical protein [Desulfocapsaceae bacterium]
MLYNYAFRNKFDRQNDPDQQLNHVKTIIMLELRFLRENIDFVKEKTAKRGVSTEKLDEFIAVDQQRLEILSEVESLKNARNTVSKEIATLKQGGEEEQRKAEPLIAEMKATSGRIKELDGELAAVQERLQEIVLGIPNICDDSVPEGQDDSDNVEIKTWGDKPSFSFTPKPHYELGEN